MHMRMHISGGAYIHIHIYELICGGWQAISIKQGQDANYLVDQHIRAGCPTASLKSKKNPCSFKGCREKEFIPISCKLCKQVPFWPCLLLFTPTQPMRETNFSWHAACRAHVASSFPDAKHPFFYLLYVLLARRMRMRLSTLP